jgi:hypothetical protein
MFRRRKSFLTKVFYPDLICRLASILTAFSDEMPKRSALVPLDPNKAIASPGFRSPIRQEGTSARGSTANSAVATTLHEVDRRGNPRTTSTQNRVHSGQPGTLPSAPSQRRPMVFGNTIFSAQETIPSVLQQPQRRRPMTIGYRAFTGNSGIIHAERQSAVLSEQPSPPAALSMRNEHPIAEHSPGDETTEAETISRQPQRSRPMTIGYSSSGQVSRDEQHPDWAKGGARVNAPPAVAGNEKSQASKGVMNHSGNKVPKGLSLAPTAPIVHWLNKQFSTSPSYNSRRRHAHVPPAPPPSLSGGYSPSNPLLSPLRPGCLSAISDCSVEDMLATQGPPSDHLAAQMLEDVLSPPPQGLSLEITPPDTPSEATERCPSVATSVPKAPLEVRRMRPSSIPLPVATRPPSFYTAQRALEREGISRIRPASMRPPSSYLASTRTNSISIRQSVASDSPAAAAAHASGPTRPESTRRPSRYSRITPAANISTGVAEPHPAHSSQPNRFGISGGPRRPLCVPVPGRRNPDPTDRKPNAGR